MSPYPHKGTCLWHKWLTMDGIEKGEMGRGKREPNCAKTAVQEGGQEGDEYSLIAGKHRWGSKATTALLNPGHAMHMRHRGTKPLQHSAIWRYEKTGLGGRERATPPLSALWQIVGTGSRNSQQAKEESTTGSWQWGEFEGAQNRVPVHLLRRDNAKIPPDGGGPVSSLASQLSWLSNDAAYYWGQIRTGS